MIRYFFIFLIFFNYAHASDVLNITFLGTGTPRPNIEKLGPSLLIKHKNYESLIDVGRGTTLRLNQIGNDFSKINEIYLSHFHFDHTIGLPDLWLTSNLWQKKTNTFVFGPAGVKKFCNNIYEAYKLDLKYRLKENSYSELVCFNFDNYEDNKAKSSVNISSFKNNHGHVDNSYGFRISFQDKKIVYSGDTSVSENVLSNAKDADILIHEVIAMSDKIYEKNKKLRDVAATHTTVKQLISILKKTKPKLTILNHALLFGVSEKSVLEKIKKDYKGEVIFSYDLMSLDVGNEINIFNLGITNGK